MRWNRCKIAFYFRSTGTYFHGASLIAFHGKHFRAVFEFALYFMGTDNLCLESEIKVSLSVVDAKCRHTITAERGPFAANLWNAKVQFEEQRRKRAITKNYSCMFKMLTKDTVDILLQTNLSPCAETQTDWHVISLGPWQSEIFVSQNCKTL